MTTTREHARIHPHVSAGCEHGWLTESRHATSEGVVLYVRCSSCGARRIDLLPAAVVIPVPLSGVVAG